MPGRHRNAAREGLLEEIEYSIIALQLAATEVRKTVMDSSGVSVDPADANFLGSLDDLQLEAVRQRLSVHPGWKRKQGAS